MRSRLTLLALAAIAILAVAVIVRLLVGPGGDGAGGPGPSIACGGMTPAGPRSPGEYPTLAEAEAAFGFDLPDVHAPGWSFHGAGAHDYPIDRENPGPPPEEGEFIGGNVRYACADGTGITLMIVPVGGRQLAWIEEVTVTNRVPVPAVHPDADMLESADGLIVVRWQDAGRVYLVTAARHGSFGEAEILDVVASLQ